MCSFLHFIIQKMAGSIVLYSLLFQRCHCLAAAVVHALAAAVLERTARRQIDRTRDFTLESLYRVSPLLPKREYRAQKRLSVRVLCFLKFSCRKNLYNVTEIHDSGAVAHLINESKVVAYEDNRKISLLLNGKEQINYLLLN